MSTDDPFPPRRVPDWPAPATEESLFTPPNYPQSINDRANVVNITNAAPLAVPTSGYAVAALILGLLGFGFIAVIFGHLALRETKTGQRSGHGMAIAGLIFGYLTVAAWVLLISMIVTGAMIGASS